MSKRDVTFFGGPAFRVKKPLVFLDVSTELGNMLDAILYKITSQYWSNFRMSACKGVGRKISRGRGDQRKKKTEN